MCNLNHTQATAIDLIAQQGWVADRLLPYGLTKMVATAVGSKNATIWVLYNPREGIVRLNGTYFSEGRNVLDACVRLIPADSGPDAVLAKVWEFLGQVERSIAESYAVRLLRSR